MLQSCKLDDCTPLLLLRPKARKYRAQHNSINLCREWIFVHQARAKKSVCVSECKCDSGEYCCSFLDATGLCLITSSCLCHRRRVVHGRELQPTLLTQGQTHRLGPGVALKQMLPPHTGTLPPPPSHPYSHTNL